MFLELIATFFAGFAVAGMFMALNHALGGRLPRGLMPVAAGAAMIGVTVWSEYTWFDRTTDNLPEGLEVAEINESQQLYRPWTFVAPLADRFVAVDVGTMRTHEAMPEQHIADIYVLGRWRPVKQFPVLVDCEGTRRALLSADAVFANDGSVSGALWADVPADDPLVSTACKVRG